MICVCHVENLRLEDERVKKGKGKNHGVKYLPKGYIVMCRTVPVKIWDVSGRSWDVSGKHRDVSGTTWDVSEKKTRNISGKYVSEACVG